MIYLDHAATTPVPKAVADAMYTVLTEQYANPNAQYPFGQEMRRSVEDWRAVIAKAVDCEANQLFFTSCGTEGDNWAIRAACWQNRHVGRHIVTTAVEHHAVLNCCQQLEQEGWEVTTILPDQNGDISAESVLAAVRPDTALVSVMMVNNELGSIYPIADIAKGLKAVNEKTLPSLPKLWERTSSPSPATRSARPRASELFTSAPGCGIPGPCCPAAVRKWACAPVRRPLPRSQALPRRWSSAGIIWRTSSGTWQRSRPTPWKS